MTAPNIVGVTTIIGITTFVNLTTTAATNIVSNPADSGDVYKINTIIAANIDGTNTANITIKIHDAAAGAGSSVPIANTIDVVADSTLVVLDKASAISSSVKDETSVRLLPSLKRILCGSGCGSCP